MSDRKINIAIVGLGFGSEFIPIYQRHPNANMYAICQRTKSKLDQIGKYFKVEKRYTEYDDLLKDKKNARVMMIRYQAGSQSTEQRDAGFRETIRTVPSVAFIEAPDEAGATVDSAQRTAETLLSDQKELDGIFVPNESSTTGVLRALEVLHREGQVKLVGFDSSDILINALRKGEIHGLVLQDPFDMGYQSVNRAIDFLQGKRPAELIKNTNLQVITPDNLDDPKIKPLYARDLQPYLGS